MEDTELEEGEACSDHNLIRNNNYSNDNGYDASIDPDIALSYIDVKLQDVLGHFQKDFEGGVSAENLGAKFGGYGSFLPTYQRSPVWSQPKTPPKNQNYNAPRSPSCSRLEGTRRSSVSSSNVPQLLKVEPASASLAPLTVSKAPSSPIMAVKRGASTVSSDLAKEDPPRYELVSKKSTKLPDQKLLKFRIKMGSDNLSMQKNAEIYSGLGLDASPSSLDDSPSGSEASHGPRDSPIESPACILEIMTSFPVLGDLLLSPLHDDLIRMTENLKLHKDTAPFLDPTIYPDSSGIRLNGSVKGDKKKFGEKKTNLPERNEMLAEPQSENPKDSQAVVDTLASQNIVADFLKLPLPLNSNSVADAVKGGRISNKSREVCNVAVRDKGSSHLMEDSMGPLATHEETRVENSKYFSSGKILEEKKASPIDSVSVYPQKGGHRKGEKSHASVKSDSSISKGLKGASSELADTLKQMSDHKFTSNEHEGTKFPPGKQHSVFDGKKKLKGSQSHANGVADLPKDSLAGCSSVPKNKRCTSSAEYKTKGEFEDSRFQKNTGIAGDRYKDFFGDFELDQEESQMSPLGTGYKNLRKDSDIDEKNTSLYDDTLKVRASGKKSDRLLVTKVHPKTAHGVIPVSGNEPVMDIAPVATAPTATEDNWVCCDKCQKWRLLPLGKNPHDLPEKWLCSMLNWLPGLNRCSISEQETTNAVMALNQVPASAGESNLLPHPGPVTSARNMVGDQFDREHQNLVLHDMPGGGKKKPGKDGPSLLSSSMKKSMQLSATNGSLNEVNQAMVSKSDFLRYSETSGINMEKEKNKKEKHKVLGDYSHRGNTRQLKMKGKRDREEDSFRVSKKIKAEGLPEDWVANTKKVGPTSSNGLPTTSSRKSLPKNNNHTSSKDQASARKSKDKVRISMDDVPTEIRNRDNGEVVKKRKVKGSYDTQVNPGSISNATHDLHNSGFMVNEEFSENECGKEKKARVSKSDGKESSASKGSGKTDRKGSHRKNMQLGKNIGSSTSQRSLEGMGYSKRDSGSLHPPAAATSSSSKVSGSHKTKASFLEMKGSPVESVSSSPLRVPKQGKLMLGQRNFAEKDDSSDAGFFAPGGRQRYSDGEDYDGSDRSGAEKRDKIVDVAHHGSHESSVLDFQEKDSTHISGSRANQKIGSSDITNHHLGNGSSDYLGQENRFSSKTTTSGQCLNDDVQHESDYYVNGSRPRKSAKGASLRSKEKNKNLNSELDKGKFKVFDSMNDPAPLCDVKLTDGKSKGEDKFEDKTDESENRYANKKDSVGPLLSENSKKEYQSKVWGHNGSDTVARNASVLRQNLLLDPEAAPGRGKSPSLPPSGGVQNEKVDKQNGTHHNGSKDPLSSGRRAKDLDAPSPVKREYSSQGATNALREAKNLKHLADRLKNTGSNIESTRFYFEAALKFLHGASLLETCSSENARNGEMGQSMQVYSTTAKLCEFCAHEYEKSKDMAAAALAYKCMELAYLRVIYSSHNSANKDRYELQGALQMVPPGESPSSSASDVDNLNHPAAVDKASLAKTSSSPQLTGSHVIAAQNRPNFMRLLSFAEDVNSAMEASRKSQIAFAAAKVTLGESQRREGIPFIKTALDFNFQDVEGLLHLVRLAFEAISR